MLAVWSPYTKSEASLVLTIRVHFSPEDTTLQCNQNTVAAQGSGPPSLCNWLVYSFEVRQVTIAQCIKAGCYAWAWEGGFTTLFPRTSEKLLCFFRQLPSPSLTDDNNDKGQRKKNYGWRNGWWLKPLDVATIIEHDCAEKGTCGVASSGSD